MAIYCRGHAWLSLLDMAVDTDGAEGVDEVLVGLSVRGNDRVGLAGWMMKEVWGLECMNSLAPGKFLWTFE